VPVPGYPVPGPDRDRPDPVSDALETRIERIRHHLRRPVPGRRDLLTMTAGNTVREIDPRGLVIVGIRAQERLCNLPL
jgi:hypothetical protein